jgi:Tol biopolymer transport system component/predicted Ser/Thr protein kinase
MGEVYRARDTRLDRSVAIKIVTDESLKQRFDREAKTISSLNHPNICSLYDVGDSYIAMELLEGETLREKLELNGAAVRLPIRKAIDYSVQIANGLAAAHEKGIVHRDLKPENIFITKDGRVKILDFGLARSSVGVAALGHPSSATQQKFTSPGTIVGTAGYMSPEQVRGQQVDHRSDIFSFGAILYEMLSGRRAFKGDSSVETMNAILKEDPPELSVSETNIPPVIDLVVRHCLEKNREERFQSARDLAFDLERISRVSGSSPALTAPKARGRWFVPVIAAAAAVIIALVAWRAGYRAATAEKPAPAVRTFTLLTNQAGVEDFPSLAPDGKTFVYVSKASGKADIYLKRVDGRNAINLTKDSQAENTQPAFSPDGSQIAFRSDREGGGIFLMGATGESVRRLTDFGFNPNWSPDGSEIAVASEPIELQPQARPALAGIDVVDVKTGARREIVSAAHDGVQPNWSPHGDRIAFWAVVGGGGQRDLFTVDPHAADPKQTIVRLTDDPPLDWNPVWSPDGKYLYFGSDRDGTLNLWRMPMDEHSGKALGPPELVPLPTRYAAHFSFARNTGELAYAGVDLSESLWSVPFDPVAMRVTGEPKSIFGGAMLLLPHAAGGVSPDGKWIAFSNLGTQEDLFLARTDGGEVRQLTNDPEKDRGATWSADGKLLYFYSQRGKRYEVWSIRVDGSGLRQVSRTSGASMWFPRIMPDGRAILEFNNNGAYLLPLNPDGTATRVEPLPPMPDPKKHFMTPTVSPDGKRLAGATGQLDGGAPGVWVYSFDSKEYEQLTDRGLYAAWMPDGRRVLFLDGAGLAVIDIASKQIRSIPLPRPIRGFDIAPDARTLYLYERTSEADIWMMTTK